MNDQEKKAVAQRLSARVSTGLMFIEFICLENIPRPDPAYIRNIYLLLSFYTELLLKGIYVMHGQFIDKEQLEESLKKLGHDFAKMGEHIASQTLQAFGVKEIQYLGPDYLIRTDVGDFRVEDFTDIRYDFIEGKVRSIPASEHEMFKQQITIMNDINKKLKQLAWA